MTSTPWAESPPRAVRPRRPVERGLDGVLALPTWAVLAAFVTVSALVRFTLAAAWSTPWLVPDELLHTELGPSLADTGHFLVRGEPYTPWRIGYGALYPLLIAPAYAVTTTSAQALVVIKAMNAVLFSSAAVPAYLLARRVLARRNALILAALALALPSAIYSAKIMSESVAYPAFLTAILAIVAALERPGLRRELLAVGAICLAVLARAEMVALVPAGLTAIVLLSLTDARALGGAPGRAFFTRLRAFRTTLVLAGCALLAVAAFLGREVVSGGSDLGASYAYFLDRLDPTRAGPPLVYLIADLDLYSGVVPLAAFLLVVGGALASRQAARSLRAFAAASAGAGVWLLLFSAVYTTMWSGHVYERYVFYLVPLFLIAFLAWIERGLPRPRRAAGGVALVVALLPLALPAFWVVDGRGTGTSTVGPVPWFWASALLGDHLVLKAATVVFAGGLALAFLRTARGDAGKLVRVTALGFLITTLMLLIDNAVAADQAREYAGTNPAGWVDAAVGAGGTVAVVWTGSTKERDKFAVWEAEFFNRRIGPVYVLRTNLRDQLPQVHARLQAGRLLDDRGAAIRAGFVLTSDRLTLAGRKVASDAGSGLVLYRVGGDIRLASAVAGRGFELTLSGRRPLGRVLGRRE